MSVSETKLLNVSESGIAILVNAHEAPYPGERLKIEMPVPGGDQIAWFAVVVRSELYWSPWSDFIRNRRVEEDMVLLALRWEQLPEGHVKAIRQGLRNRFLEELKENRARQWLYIRHFWNDNAFKIAMYFFCTMFAVLILYLLARPSANYDPRKGTPWGQRFQLFDWNGEK